MNHARRFMVGILAVLLLSDIGSPSVACAETVKIGGAGFELGIMKILAATFEKSHPGIAIEVLPSLGSTGGIKALLAGSLDLAISSRPLNDAEKRSDAVARELARTPFIFMANQSVGAEGITTRELEKIYGGGIVAWPDGKRLRLVLRPNSEMDTEIVRKLSPAMDAAVTSALSREGMIRATTDQKNAGKIEKTPGALGSGTLAQVYGEKRRVKVLSYNGITPSVEKIKDGSYPLSKSLYLVSTAKTSPAARQFVAFILSRAGSAIMARYGNLVLTTDKSSTP